MIHHRVVMSNYRQQMANAAHCERVMAREAIRLGCTVYQDTVICHNPQQWDALEKAWRELNNE